MTKHTEGPAALAKMLNAPLRHCRIRYAERRADGTKVCGSCKRPVKEANTLSGWRHV